jgi:Ca-activated chloride channel homolog
MHMRTISIIAGLAGLLVLIGGASTARAQSNLPPPAATSQSSLPEQFPISVSTNLVDLPVSVTDREGNFVDGLEQKNFRVFENGREEKISMFGRQDLPVAVGLVVDHSASMGPKLAEISAAAEAFARSSNPEDHLFVVNFNDVVSIALPSARPFTSDESELRAALAENRAEGQTALYDAMIDSLRHLSLSSLKRQALILVTDGGDNISRHTLPDALEAAMRSQARIFCIGIYDGEDPDASPRVLRKLAKATGGDAYFPSSPAQVNDIVRRIAVNLRKQYTLGFAPDDRAEGWRTIRVVASGNEKLTVHARAGYLFSNGKTTLSPYQGSLKGSSEGSMGAAAGESQ